MFRKHETNGGRRGEQPIRIGEGFGIARAGDCCDPITKDIEAAKSTRSALKPNPLRVPPKIFQIVIRPGLPIENMHHHIHIIRRDPC